MRSIVCIFMLLVVLSCKKEVEFNPNIHIATADAINFEVSEFRASARAGNGYRGLSENPSEVKYLSISIEYDAGNNLDALTVWIRLPSPPVIACDSIPYIDNITWYNADTFMASGFAFATEIDAIGDQWVINDDRADSFTCIESISDTGEEIAGSFDLHFTRIPDSVLPGSRWPDSFSLVNGKFRAFVLDN